MKKNTLLNSIAFVLSAFTIALTATAGDIFEIRPLEGSCEASSALKSGQKLKFLMRLVARDWDAPNPQAWVPKYVGSGSAELGKINMPKVGIGHSWGGSSLVLDVLGHKSCRHIPVMALITLDPVAIRPPRFLPQVRRWLNVYLPYDKAPWSRENNVARLGRPWGFLKQASINYAPSALRHSRALDMFREFGAAFIELVMLDEELRKQD